MILRTVMASSLRLLPAESPQETFARAYASVLTVSDFNCINALIEQGKIEVVIDATTKVVNLIPAPEVEKFLELCFKSATERLAVK